jgi:hypothetical protein
MRKIPFLIFIFSSFIGFSQPRKRVAPVTVRGVIGIPRSVSSQMFRTSFSGVYEGNLSVNVRLFTNFFAGVGYQNSFFQNNKKVFVYYTAPQGQSTTVSLSYNTKLMGNAGFIKIGYDQLFERGYFSYSINTGYMRLSYNNVHADTASENKPFVGLDFGSAYVQPEIAVNFIADRAVSFSIFLGYTTLFYKYDPKAPRFAHVAEVKDSKNNYYMGWINIGFGFNIHIGSNK